MISCWMAIGVLIAVKQISGWSPVVSSYLWVHVYRHSKDLYLKSLQVADLTYTLINCEEEWKYHVFGYQKLGLDLK